MSISDEHIIKKYIFHFKIANRYVSKFVSSLYKNRARPQIEIYRQTTALFNQNRYYLLQEVPTLKPEYETVHQLREAFQERDLNEFKEGLLTVNSKQLSDGLNRVLQTFKKLLPYIQNTCEYPTLSNGPIEGINNKIKVLKRNAYGYSSFTHFRNRILLMSKLFTPTTKKGIKQPDAA